MAEVEEPLQVALQEVLEVLQEILQVMQLL
jgi:hypothetical protein